MQLYSFYKTYDFGNVFIEILLIFFHYNEVLTKIIYDSHQNIQLALSIVVLSDLSRSLMKLKGACAELATSLHHISILRVLVFHLGQLVLESGRENIDCVPLQLFFIMQALK